MRNAQTGGGRGRGKEGGGGKGEGRGGKGKEREDRRTQRRRSFLGSCQQSKVLVGGHCTAFGLKGTTGTVEDCPSPAAVSGAQSSSAHKSWSSEAEQPTPDTPQGKTDKTCRISASPRQAGLRRRIHVLRQSRPCWKGRLLRRERLDRVAQ